MTMIGKINAVNGRKARVFFPDTGLMSDWLYVLQHPQNGQTAAAEGHRHDFDAGQWSPAIGDVVLCLFGDGFNADGFILGVIG